MMDWLLRLWRAEFIRRIVASVVMGAFAAFGVWDIFTILKISISTSAIVALTGFYSLPWAVMFFTAYFLIRKTFSFNYSVFFAAVGTFLCTSTWEISINVMTIYYTPTISQIALTIALAFPFLVLAYPLIHELRKLEIYEFGIAKYIKFCLVIPVTIGILLLLIRGQGGLDFLFDSMGYPVYGLMMFLRIAWAFIFLVVIFAPLHSLEAKGLLARKPVKGA